MKNSRDSKDELDAERIIRFIEELDLLKDKTRTAWTSGGRRESIAGHSWRLAMLVLACGPYLPGIDLYRLLRICLVHDLGEAYDGDISAALEPEAEGKAASEDRAVEMLCGIIGGSTAEEIQSLYREYAAGESREAKAAKALDKIETIIQHNQGKNPDDFNYAFNLDYGRMLAEYDPFINSIRQAVDRMTASRAGKKS
jgi:putative hydrolase of HD superfamily